MSTLAKSQEIPMAETLKRTPLYEEHLALKAKMVPFGGWEMPVQYEGIIAEYEATRKRAALFDTSHMGEFIVEGDCVKTGLDRLVTLNLVDMPVKTCRYGALLNPSGGGMGDLIVFRTEKDKWFIVVNGGTTEKDAAHFRKHIIPGAFSDISLKTGKLDLQGPQAREILKTFVPGIGKLEQYYSFDDFDFLGQKVMISRTGYTGELGYEIFVPWQDTVKFWRAILKINLVKPAGLGARDCLRIEMGYSLYGHELSDTISPLEAGLDKFIDFNKEFIGKEALVKQKEQGVKRKLIAFVSEDRRSPRAQHKIYSSDLKEIGEVASGSFAPALTRGIRLGFVRTPLPAAGEKIYFGDEKTKSAGEVAKRPFYKNGSLKI